MLNKLLNKALHKLYVLTKKYKLKVLARISNKIKTLLFNRGKLAVVRNDLSRLNLGGCANPLHYNMLSLQNRLRLLYGSSMMYNLIYTEQNDYPLIVCEVAVSNKNLINAYLIKNLNEIKEVVEYKTDVLFSYTVYEFEDNAEETIKNLTMSIKYN